MKHKVTTDTTIEETEKDIAATKAYLKEIGFHSTTEEEFKEFFEKRRNQKKVSIQEPRVMIDHN